MNIHGLGSVPNLPKPAQSSAPQPIEKSTPTESAPQADRVEISAEPEQPDGARALRLAKIKADIESGDYETPEKLEAALSRMFGEIGLDDMDD